MSSKVSTEPAGLSTRRISRRTVLLGVGAIAGAGGATAAGLAIWNAIHEHTAVYIYRGSDEPIYALAWSPNGQRLAGGGPNAVGTSIWDALTGEHLLTLSEHDYPSMASSLAWSPDGTRLATAHADVIVWDARRGRRLATYSVPDKGAPPSGVVPQTTVAWSPDGTRLISGCKSDPGPNNPTARIWDVTSGKALLALHDLRPGTAPGILYAVAWSPDGRWIATAGFSFMSDEDAATFQIWNAMTGELTFTHRETREVTSFMSVAWSPESKRVVTGNTSGQAQIWDIPSGHVLLTYHGHRGFVNAVGWSPDGKWVASAASDTTAQVWDAETGQTAYTYRGHSDILSALAWSPDGAYVATGSDDQTVQIWRPR